MTDHTGPGELRSALLSWFDRHRRDLPWRRTRDPYGIWVSEVMLQQTQVSRVEGYWTRFLQKFPTVRALAEAPLDDVLAAWSGLGYYSRARNLHRAAQQIAAEHGGRLPRTGEQLLALSGFGRYTAGAVASIAFGEPAPVVDGKRGARPLSAGRHRGCARRPRAARRGCGTARASWSRATGPATSTRR